MEEIRIPELTLEQVEKLCERAEQAAREYILSEIPKNKISNLDVIIDAEETKHLTVNVDVAVYLSPLMKDFDVEALTKAATKNAFAHIEEFLRELTCTSAKY